jgi:uncharacterized protein
VQKFILTRELGRLAKWLRILGFDTVYFNRSNRASLVITALREDRIIVTRNLRLPAPKGVKLVSLKGDLLDDQLKQLLAKLEVKPDKSRLFSRCTICNAELVSVAKEKVKDKVPEYVLKTQEDFLQCPTCNKIYWSGTHWGNVLNTLQGID